MTGLAFEDLEVGRDYPLGSYAVTREEIIAFAADFDPQPFHLDEAAAADSMFGGLAASGWHTAAMAMRLMYDGVIAGSTAAGGLGVDRLDWRRPVRPGDTLIGRLRVVDKRLSQSRPGFGIVRAEVVVENGDGETVLTMVAPALFGLREAGA